jgi:hypothetical protein
MNVVALVVTASFEVVMLAVVSNRRSALPRS